jgi:DNA polymerase III epsilon subunit-like protein
MLANGRNWLQRFVDTYGLPDNYLVFDLETSGFRPHGDVIIQWSVGIVKDRKLIANVSQSLNWVDDPRICSDWLDSALSEIRKKLNLGAHDLTHPFSLQHLKTYGLPPDESLAELRSLLHDSEHLVLVGHNHIDFDIPMLEGNLERFVPECLPCCAAAMDCLDTGALAVGMQLNSPIVQLPRMEDFSRLVLRRKRDAHWKLQSVCVELFGLRDTKDLVAAAHTASADTQLVYKIVEAVRERTVNEGCCNGGKKL